MIYPNFIDHLVFRVRQLDRTERFYSALFGPPSHYAEESVMYEVGPTRLFFTISLEPQPRPHNKEAIGMNHIAFGVRSLSELQALQSQLNMSGLIHSGILLDRYGLKEFIWLDDPDGLRIEFYLRAE
jgi:glyoxylase I family protein